MAKTIENGAAYLESEARSKHVCMSYDIEAGTPDTAYDDLYVFRIVQNLVGNSIKAVYETIEEETLASTDEDEFLGTVLVRYSFKNSEHWFEVVDSGPGMPPEVARRILSGNARSQWSKAGGSGWGTKIVLELANSHDGKVEIESEPGHGSTFRVRFPHCPTAEQRN
jgi:signal transduction histidine kinase